MRCHSTSDAPLLWHLCCCFAGVFALVALAPSQSLQWQLCSHCAGVVVVGTPMLPPALHWCLCQKCDGVVALFALVSFPSLCWRHCHCCTGVPTIVVLALFLFALTLSPLPCWHLHRRCTSIIAFVAMVSPLLLHWYHWPHHAGIFPLLHCHLWWWFYPGINCPRHADVLTIIFLTLSPKAHIALVSLLLLH